ncbi:MAG TPA: NAD(P)/FAD-dependent oxidoreductase [Solirubrobacteraceae bacterium]
MDYDALIIGSGPNGLTAAIRLARAGRRVLVLEAADRPGGAVVTEQLTLPGFLHDTFSSVYPAAAASPVYADMPLERHGLRWIHPAVCMAHPVSADGAAIGLYRDLDRTAASIDALCPGDGAHWHDFAAPFVENFDALRLTMLAGFPPLAGPARLLAGIGVRGMVDFVRLLLMPAQALGEELFQGTAAQAWLYGAAMHSDVPPPGSGSAIAAAYLNLLGHGAGWPSPEGGAGRLAAALVGYLESQNGHVRTAATVARIASERGRVVGVELTGGERITAPQVIANVMPHALLRLTGDDLGGRYAQALGRYRYGPSTLKIDWALNGPIPWTSAIVRDAGTVHVGGDAAEVLATTSSTEGLPERPFLLLGQQSLADPSRAPAGKHTAWAYTHGPQSTDWATEQARHVDRVEAQVERFAPGFRERILARHVLGPRDLERRNQNLVGGDVGGGSYTLDQVVFRPVPSLSPYRTPLRGLYLTGAATFPGGAAHGVCGHAAAGLVLTEDRLRGGPIQRKRTAKPR